MSRTGRVVRWTRRLGIKDAGPLGSARRTELGLPIWPVCRQVGFGDPSLTLDHLTHLHPQPWIILRKLKRETPKRPSGEGCQPVWVDAFVGELGLAVGMTGFEDNRTTPVDRPGLGHKELVIDHCLMRVVGDCDREGHVLSTESAAT